MKHLMLIVVLIGSFATATAQQLKGAVKNSEGKIVEYVNIGIVDGDIGTIADEKGLFNIRLHDSLNHQIIRFSRLGFKSYEATVSDFKRTFSGTVILENDVIIIPDVAVDGSSYKRGVSINQRGMRVPTGILVLKQQEMIENGLERKDKVQKGFQMGNIIQLDKVYIPESMEFTVAKCYADSVLFRVTIYELDKDSKVAKILNNSEIYIAAYKNDSKQSYNVDLSSQNLSLIGRHYFGIEIVNYIGSDKYDNVVAFPLFTSATYYRGSSQGAFLKFPYNFGIKIKASVKK